MKHRAKHSLWFGVALLLTLLLWISRGEAQKTELQLQEVSRFAFATHDMSYARQPVIQYPYVYIPNSYGFQVCVWDSTANTFTEIANYGVPGMTHEMVAWQDYLFLSVFFGSGNAVGPDAEVLFRIDISDPHHPQPAGSITAGTAGLSYRSMRLANGVLLASTQSGGFLQELVCIDPQTLSITHSYPGHYHFETIADGYVITRPYNSAPFHLFSVDPATGLTALGTVTLPHYPVNTFPRFADLGPSVVGSQCGSGMYIFQLTDILNWQQMSFIEGGYDSNGVICNGYLVFGDYETDMSRLYVYDISNLSQPLLVSSDPYPPGLEEYPAMERLLACGDFLFHSCTFYGCLCLKVTDSGTVVFAGECYDLPMYSSFGCKYGNYILQPVCFRGIACFDISQPESPQYAFSVFPDRTVYALVNGNYLLAWMTPAGSYGTLTTEAIYDISDLQNPQLVWSQPYSLQSRIFFNPREPEHFYCLAADGLSVSKYQISGGQASLLFSHPNPVVLRDPVFNRGILYQASVSPSSPDRYDLYATNGFEQNTPQAPVVREGFIPGLWAMLDAGNYLYIRDYPGPTCIFHNELSTFEVASDIRAFAFHDYVCVGRPDGVSFYDTTVPLTGFQTEDLFLPQYSYSVNIAWDDEYLYLFGQDNIAIYAYTLTTGANGEELPKPPEIQLSASPNPFSGSVEISFELKSPARAELAVYNLRGQKLRDLSSASYGPGKHSLTWDGKDHSGTQVPAGIYLLRLRAEGLETAFKKISKY